ncbi:MAG: tRNA (adenosine(37)-N6)-threonylcarbamoyltransferase complex transferase subunit TsaD [bacterium]|nr:tRNA (adenosine(37)-N6)-threonylcarbamoyltransferase complex transferase subunit TsaD [bacterium]
MITLGIDTSCDDTSASCVKDGKVLSNIVFSQVFHSKYGGVMPELAARDHLKNITFTVKEAVTPIGFNNLDNISATYGPGLIGSLLVGLSFAKSLSYVKNIPFYAVNHIEGHIFSLFIENKISCPFICLVVSGGHTELVYVKEMGEYEIMGRTLDDAAGESFDKVARMLKLTYPGGQAIEKLAERGNPIAIKFPCSKLKDYNFSFSGIKTAVLYYIKNNPNAKTIDVAASFQKAVIDSLTNTTFECALKLKVNSIAISGGVSRNNKLRERFTKISKQYGIKFYCPEKDFCTDNAVMIALCAQHYFKNKIVSPFNIKANSRASLIRS